MPGNAGPLCGLILGSVAGGLGRYFLARAINERAAHAFPWGTLTVNLAGCLLMGLFYRGMELKPWFSPAARMLLLTGFCGAFTTFSAFALEATQLLKAGQAALAAGYVVGSVVLGLGLFWTGAFLGR